MATHKAVILAAGRGTRMKTHSGPAITLDPAQEQAADRGIKGMIPVPRPFLDYAISALADAGITDVCIVTGPGPNAIKDYYENIRTERVAITFAVQKEPKGAADALTAAEEFADNNSFLLVNSDNYYPVHTLRALRETQGAAVTAFESNSLITKSNIEETRVRDYAVMEINEDSTLHRIIEKPDDATIVRMGSRVYVSMNSWQMPPSIFDACRSIAPSKRGELELQTAVQYAIDTRSAVFQVLPFEDGVLDLSTRADIPAVAARLEAIEPRL